MKKVLFIDRDGTMVLEPENYELSAFEHLEFYPCVFQYLARIAAELDYELVMVSNQDGLGSPAFSEENFFRVHNFIMKCFENENIYFSKVLIDRTYPHENSWTRKPGTGMLTEYLNNSEYDIKNSFVIGDRITDVILAKNLNCKALWLNNNSGLGAGEVTETADSLKDYIALNSPDWKDVYDHLKNF
ncbi:hypothetical protein BH09BAC2_BH09BAC2_20130 [soil metagenome]